MRMTGFVCLHTAVIIGVLLAVAPTALGHYSCPPSNISSRWDHTGSGPRHFTIFNSAPQTARYTGENFFFLVCLFLNMRVYTTTFFFLNSFLGPISSVLVNKYGSRPVMIAGGCLSGCGLIAASFCNTVQELYLCIGVIGGE